MSPGEWKPRNFNSSQMEYEEACHLTQVMKEAQKVMEPFQEYYERCIKGLKVEQNPEDRK